MEGGRVEFSLGPCASDVALAWIANARHLLKVVNDNRFTVSVEVHEDVVSFCDALLSTWESIAASRPTFEWSFTTSAELIEKVIEQWIQIGSLSADELEVLGVSWAPEWTKPMADAVGRAALAVLPQLSHDARRRFVEQIDDPSA